MTGLEARYGSRGAPGGFTRIEASSGGAFSVRNDTAGRLTTHRGEIGRDAFADLVTLALATVEPGPAPARPGRPRYDPLCAVTLIDATGPAVGILGRRSEVERRPEGRRLLTALYRLAADLSREEARS